MRVEGRVGAISAAEGSINTLRTDERGALAVTAAGGSLADAAIAGRLFSVANQTHVTTTAALATTWTGLGVGNPAASGKLYVFHEFGWAQEVVMNTEGSYGLMVATNGAEGSTGMSAAIVARCARYGYATTSALCDDGATIGTPILIRHFGSSMEGAITTVPSLGGNIYDLKGSIVIPPGYALLTYTFAIQTNSVLFHFVWEEIDE
jgi:hypothetical protein